MNQTVITEGSLPGSTPDGRKNEGLCEVHGQPVTLHSTPPSQ